MDDEFTNVPQWLLGPIATLASIMALALCVSAILILLTNDMQLKKVQLKLPQLDILSCLVRWVKTPPAQQDLDIEQGLKGDTMPKRRKRRVRKSMSKFFLFSQENQSEEGNIEEAPYDLDDSAWLTPSEFIKVDADDISSAGSDVFNLDDNTWCSVPVTE